MLEENQNILCTVRDIQGTTVFVDIENEGEGTIVTSEIAPGRIRNLRDYVVPGKKIVCKVLQVETNNARLSLRRVSEKERREVMEKFQLEKNALSILRTIVKNSEEVINKIKEKENSLYDFLQKCKDSPEKLEKYFEKTEVDKICKILQERKEKSVEVKKEFLLSSSNSQGISVIKKILNPFKENITYLAAGRYLIKFQAQDYKKANHKVQEILFKIESEAKKEKASFEVKEK